MSDDIIDRLRYEYGFGDRLEAADEITRLRAENEKLRVELREADAMLLKQARTIRELSNGRYGQ